ncbi:MAG: YcgL domain-containing protein [Oceanobacter sp.]
MSKQLCDVYKSPKKDETYLYVTRKDGLSKVPDELMETFGKPELALTMILTPEKQLARTDGQRVLDELEEKGFYLQLPPPRETYMLDLFCKKDKSDHE